MYIKRIIVMGLFYLVVWIVKVGCLGFMVVEGRLKIFFMMDRVGVVDLLVMLCEKVVL